MPHGAVFVVDRDLRYLLAEGQAIEEVGMASEDFVGKTIWEALEPDVATNYYESLYHPTLTGELCTIEHHIQGHDFVTHSTPLVNNQGKIYAALAMSYDITLWNQKL
jgi:PAS domain-containing protein